MVSPMMIEDTSDTTRFNHATIHRSHNIRLATVFHENDSERIQLVLPMVRKEITHYNKMRSCGYYSVVALRVGIDQLQTTTEGCRPDRFEYTGLEWARQTAGAIGGFKRTTTASHMV